MHLHQYIFAVFWLTSCGYATVRGGAPERIAGAAQLAAGLFTIILSFALRPTAGAYASMEVGVALTDMALFGIITAVALNSTRFWPIVQASMAAPTHGGHGEGEHQHHPA